MKNIIAILKLSKPLHHLLALLAVLIVTGTLLALVAPLLSRVIVDEVVKEMQTGDGNIEKLIFYVVVAFAASIGSVFVHSISERVGDHFAGRLRKFLTETFYDKAFTLSQTYYDSELSGKIVNQLVRGIQTIQGFLNAATNFIIPTFLQSIIIVFVLWRYDPLVALFIAVLFPVYILLSHQSTVRWGKEEELKNRIEDVTRGRIQETIANMSLVKSFIRQKDEYEFVSRNLDESNRIYARQSQTFHIYDFLRGLALQVTLFGVNLFVFWNAFHGKLTIGETVLILQMVNQARMPLFAMSFILTQLQIAEAGSKEYLVVLGLASEENYRTYSRDTKRFKEPTVEFRDVEFAYETSGRVLDRVSFILNRQDTVALVGPSGAGKSTIVNLLLKFYEPTKGDIFINGISYKKLDHSTIRGNISLVFQENELFSSTIRYNVSYGKPGATDTEIIRALKLANAYDFVMKLPKGMESEIGERGVRLSGGQKQRIQIARAILKDAPILILDEATSSLDAKSEKEVQDALDTLMKKKLVIIIAHRFSTIQNVDKVVVVEEGKVVDFGKPQELARRKGIYADLLHYQIQGNRRLLEKFEIY
ncbi:ABC transporter ATP-binding protein [Candidatus Gottesmanbacteria bacterium]|nr:ABC transporter ATP-binding protein [Candidatus Gottesmanbacteria bacterium]